MPTREPAVAGQFYPDSESACQTEADECLAATPKPAAGLIVGGIVPHAGWVCSGAVAGEVLRAIAESAAPETWVIFGATHRPTGPFASVYAAGAWETPLGRIEIDEELGRATTRVSTLIIDDPDAHGPEHAIEVQVPFIQRLSPKSRILPIMVPPTASAHEIGRLVADRVGELGRRAVFVGSTDLTHYGPRYRFAPVGMGRHGIEWAKDVNDRRIIDVALALAADKVVGEAMANRNACGSGAMAATIAACLASGASAARLLRHTTSYEVLRSRLGEMDDAVGYAGIVFERPQR